ncbi:MAG TPA: NAD(+) synthase [Syntrophobacteraceae bacterium]|nr:NAD(+) synthase [Syntrophobacteraceae bacterium]
MPSELQIQEISNWLVQQLPRFSAHGVVFEIDARIETAIVAALAKKALDSHVMALILPCHGTKQQLDEAVFVAEYLHVPHTVLDLTSTHDLLLSQMSLASVRAPNNLLQRLKMATLYHHAECRNYLVLGSTNLADWEIGRFVVHGDIAADIQPLIHMLRRDTLQLAFHLGLPPQVLQDAYAHSMHLEESVTSELGFSYYELDQFLSGQEVPEEVQTKIQLLQHAAAVRKHPAARLSVADHAAVSERSDQDIYDKSVEALTIISKAITSDQYLEDILRLIVMVTAEVMNSSVCSLWLLDEREGVLRLRATQSINSEYLKERVLKVGEGVVGKVVAENQPYIAANVLTDTYYKEKELARHMGLVSMISVPMRVKDHVIGVINCYTSHPHVFSDLQMNLFTAVANQAAVAIENTELMVKTKVIQEELENRKLIERAKDLVMKRFGIPGDEAYRWLQKRSMNTRKSMRQVAEAVLLAMEN